MAEYAEKMRQARAQLAEAEERLAEAGAQHHQVSVEATEMERLVSQNLAALLVYIPTPELAGAARERVMAQSGLPSMRLAQAEASRRVAQARVVVDGLRADIGRYERLERVPEIRRRMTKLVQALPAVRAELDEICAMWPSHETGGMPEVVKTAHHYAGWLYLVLPTFLQDVDK